MKESVDLEEGQNETTWQKYIDQKLKKYVRQEG